MISLTRLSGSQFALNCDLLERVDETPDTVITLSDGTRYVVADSLRSVITKVRMHRAEVIALSEAVRVDPDAEALHDAQLTAQIATRFEAQAADPSHRRHRPDGPARSTPHLVVAGPTPDQHRDV